jgi:tetratricopeptide (TPR) repeat protein
MTESRRLDDLRRRVREDPASIVFALLAEELRRAGRFREAVAVCRTGLRAHPAYVSARVTLARALAATGEEDEARRELQAVLLAAPENLTALREMADLCRRHGELSEAIRGYRIALDLSPGHVELEQTLRALSAEQDETRRDSRASADLHRQRALRKIARLERWLTAIHGSRTLRHA